MKTPLFRYFLVLICVLWASAASASDLSGQKETPVPQTVTPGLNYLLSMVGPEHLQTLNEDAIQPVIDFILSSKDKSTLYYPENHSNMSSAYYGFDIHKSLKYILELGFNPHIPPFILSPSSIRLSYWAEIDGKKQELPNMAEMLSQLDKPYILNGIEHEEITPDVNTGAYYGYDLNRTLILLKYQGKPVLISIARQKDISDVGKKGLVLGKDDNWDYFYSGQKGLNKPGLGWVSSYMYGSSTISVYIQQNDSLVRCGIYKWLRAGWANMNMVQNIHIYRGLKRYTKTLTQVLEYPSLPSPDKMSEAFAAIQAFTENELRAKVIDYISKLSRKYSQDAMLIKDTTQDKGYVDHLDIHQMQSILTIEYMKYLMGKNTIQDIAYFINPVELGIKGT